MPGVSRSGAALTAARLRGLSRDAAAALALRAALPVTVGAGALKGARAAREGVARRAARPGRGGRRGGASSRRSRRCRWRAARGWRAVAAYRIALGAGRAGWRSRTPLA